MRRTLSALLLSLIVTALLLGGVALAGKLTRARLRQQGAHTIRLTDIDFNPPPGQDRDLFLAELQYEGLAGDEINLLEDKPAVRLVEIFRQHPRVEEVERVTIEPNNHVRVRIRYRMPVLAVALDDGVRVIDSHGILLPPSVACEGLPVLRETPLPPLVESGNAWADDRMLAAAQTAQSLQAYQDELHLVTISARDKGAIMLRTKAGTTVLWGHAPTAESADEPAAVQKVQQLQEYCHKFGDLDHPVGGLLEHDVRKSK